MKELYIEKEDNGIKVDQTTSEVKSEETGYSGGAADLWNERCEFETLRETPLQQMRSQTRAALKVGEERDGRL